MGWVVKPQFHSWLASCALSGPYRAMRAAMRCERRCVVNTEWRCDAMQKSWRCAFSLRKSSAMRSQDAKTLAMRCRDAGHSGRARCAGALRSWFLPSLSMYTKDKQELQFPRFVYIYVIPKWLRPHLWGRFLYTNSFFSSMVCVTHQKLGAWGCLCVPSTPTFLQYKKNARN